MRDNEKKARTMGTSLPLIGILILLWGWVVLLVFGVDPEVIKNIVIPNTYLPFLLVLFAAVGMSVYLWRRSFSKALVWAIVVLVYFILRLVDLGHIVNLMLLLGLLVSMEYYWHFLAQDRQ